MSRAPAFQFYASDRAMELMGMDNEAVGAWTRAMMYLWTAGPTPEERLQHVAGKGWERVRFLFADFAGGKSLEWMEILREKQRIFRENAAKNGARGGRPRKEKKGTLTEPKPNLNRKERVGSMKYEEEECIEEKERARAGAQPRADRRDPEVQALIDYLTETLRAKGIAQSLDVDRISTKTGRSIDGNRAAARHLLNKLARDYPSHPAVESAMKLVDFATSDPFHGPKSTKVGYLYRNLGSIAAQAKKTRNGKTATHADLAAGVEQILRAKYGS